MQVALVEPEALKWGWDAHAVLFAQKSGIKIDSAEVYDRVRALHDAEVQRRSAQELYARCSHRCARLWLEFRKWQDAQAEAAEVSK